MNRELLVYRGTSALLLASGMVAVVRWLHPATISVGTYSLLLAAAAVSLGCWLMQKS